MLYLTHLALLNSLPDQASGRNITFPGAMKLPGRLKYVARLVVRLLKMPISMINLLAGTTMTKPHSWQAQENETWKSYPTDWHHLMQAK